VAQRKYQGTGGRFVGMGGLLGTAHGYIGTSVYVVLGGTALYALGATPFLLLAVGAVLIVTAWSYAELSAAMPEASGVASFARRAAGPMAGFAAGWAVLLDSVIFVAIACASIPHYLGAVWPQLQERPYSAVVGLVAVGLLVALNGLGLTESVRLSSLTAVLCLATLVLLVGVGLIVLLEPGTLWREVDLGAAPTWRQLLFAVPLAAAAFVGLDAVSSRAGSAARPARDVPLAVNLVTPLVVVLGFGLAVVALSALPVGSNVVPVDPGTGLTQPVRAVPGEENGVFVLADDPATEVVVPVRQDGTGHVIPAQEPPGEVVMVDGAPAARLYGTLLGSAYLQDPLMGLVASLPDDLAWLEDILRPWLAILISVALFLAANAILGGSARVAYSLARHHQAPAPLGRVGAQRMTPYVGITLFGALAAVLLLPRDPLILFGLFGFGALLAFTAAHLSVIVLRYREKGLGRPFVVPLGVRWRGAVLPLPALAGAAATALCWALMLATHSIAGIVGFAWMAAGLLLYVAHRRRAGYPLVRQPRETALPSAARSNVDYERILVPVVGTRLSDEMMVLGCQLAADKGATIDVVYVVEVPMHLPLGAPPTDEQERGRRVLDAALAVAREFGVEARSHLVTARRPGHAIVEAAEEWNADVIILGALRKLRLDNHEFGDSVTYVLRHAPCEVLVNLVPADYPMQGSADEIDAERSEAADDSAHRADARGE